jgi:glycosyltransferase involved in cell wall biosynthesis
MRAHHSAARYDTIAAVVGIALLTLAPGRMGGSETYARGLAAALSEHGAYEYIVALPPDVTDVGGGLPVVTAGAAAVRARPVALVCAAAARQALAAADIVHYPLTISVPPTSKPRVVTLHDLLHLDLPELVPHRVRLFRRLAYDRAARRADRVIVPSAFVRDRAIRKLGLDPGRVRVIEHAVDTAVFYPDGGMREPFLLYPARAWPHKNHVLLFEAFARVRRQRPELELVLTGGGHDGLRLPEGVRSRGIVDIEELAMLYRRASAVVFPSRYEGFGLPVLEALASACPVVAASGTAVEEIADGAAVTFAPAGAEGFGRGILSALDADPGLVEDGVIAARSFSWERVARLHDDVYGELT